MELNIVCTACGKSGASDTARLTYASRCGSCGSPDLDLDLRSMAGGATASSKVAVGPKVATVKQAGIMWDRDIDGSGGTAEVGGLSLSVIYAPQADDGMGAYTWRVADSEGYGDGGYAPTMDEAESEAEAAAREGGNVLASRRTAAAASRRTAADYDAGSFGGGSFGWGRGEGANADLWSYVSDLATKGDYAYVAAVEDMHNGTFEWSVFEIRQPGVPDAASGLASDLASAQAAAQSSCDTLNGGSVTASRRTAISTPWGQSDEEYQVAPGVLVVGTPSHGGIKTSPSITANIESWLATHGYDVAAIEKYDPRGWWEEDVAQEAVIAAHPEWFTGSDSPFPGMRGKSDAEVSQGAIEILNRYYAPGTTASRRTSAVNAGDLIPERLLGKRVETPNMTGAFGDDYSGVVTALGVGDGGDRVEVTRDDGSGFQADPSGLLVVGGRHGITASRHTADGSGSSYGWIIDKDYLSGRGEKSDAGTMGPSGISDDKVNRLNNGEGEQFTMHDSDGETNYIGRIIDDAGGVNALAPLDDFGTPNAGSTDIRYHGKSASLRTAERDRRVVHEAKPKVAADGEFLYSIEDAYSILRGEGYSQDDIEAAYGCLESEDSDDAGAVSADILDVMRTQLADDDDY